MSSDIEKKERNTYLACALCVLVLFLWWRTWFLQDGVYKCQPVMVNLQTDKESVLIVEEDVFSLMGTATVQDEKLVGLELDGEQFPIEALGEFHLDVQNGWHFRIIESGDVLSGGLTSIEALSCKMEGGENVVT